MSGSGSDSAATAMSQDGDHVTMRRKRKLRKCTLLVDDESSPNPMKTRLKVPSFSPEDPEIWFALLEGQFAVYGIDDDAAKFAHVTSNLDVVHAKAVKDIILTPPAENRYERIKTELVRRLSASHEKKIRQLLTHEELGDRKPSQFLRHLQDLAGPSVPLDFIKTVWRQRLPTIVQTVLASQTSLSPEQLADLADNIQETVAPCNVAATSCNSRDAASEIAELRKMVEQLSLKVDECTRASYSSRSSGQQHSPSRRHRSRNRSRSRSRSSANHRNHPTCWYHYNFGDKAARCDKPCDYTGKV
ncbi:uncharacterized protein LOC142982808 [Anticarsia gemmatalis]|uniref:uncharacterized protein LOC142982808 n=1 Tax=Anticarsia gemmatalis TaxID=129554 RepID=UPI003F75988D